MKTAYLFVISILCGYVTWAQVTDSVPVFNQDTNLLNSTMVSHTEPYQRGQASYYNIKLKGRKTASGEIYQPDSLTAAHMKLPVGTMIKVCSELDSSCVIVKVNDRGPYSKLFVIDLSNAAAKQIGLTRVQGHIPVWIELIPATATTNDELQE